MRLFTRSAALALMLLLGQFTLVGSGYACLGGTHADTGASAESMSVRAAPDEHADCDDASRPMHCLLSDFSCTALGACAGSAMMSDAVSGARIVGLPHERAAGSPGTAMTRSIAPELPPPRA